MVAWDFQKGGLHVFHAKATLLATGGYARAWKITTNAHANTGDGLSMILRAGLPLEDMEFVQFHPTGIYPHGILVSEAARGEGGLLYNGKGERFMDKYAKAKMELAPRDVVSRAEQSEIDEGRGVNGQPYINLDLTHLGAEKIHEVLPQIHELAIKFCGLDCTKEPIPIQPSAHYSMGGIPTTTTRAWRPTRTALPSRASMRPGSAPAFPSTGRIGWARTRRSSAASMAGGPDSRSWPTFARTRRTRSTCPTDPDGPSRDEIARLLSKEGGGERRRGPP